MLCQLNKIAYLRRAHRGRGSPRYATGNPTPGVRAHEPQPALPSTCCSTTSIVPNRGVEPVPRWVIRIRPPVHETPDVPRRIVRTRVLPSERFEEDTTIDRDNVNSPWSTNAPLPLASSSVTSDPNPLLSVIWRSKSASVRPSVDTAVPV